MAAPVAAASSPVSGVIPAMPATDRKGRLSGKRKSRMLSLKQSENIVKRERIGHGYFKFSKQNLCFHHKVTGPQRTACFAKAIHNCTFSL